MFKEQAEARIRKTGVTHDTLRGAIRVGDIKETSPTVTTPERSVEERVENENGNTLIEQFVSDYDEHENEANDMHLTSKDRQKLYSLLKQFKKDTLQAERQKRDEVVEAIEKIFEEIETPKHDQSEYEEIYCEALNKLKALTQPNNTK